MNDICFSYKVLPYMDRRVREICHGVKENDAAAIYEMADYFLNLGILNSKSVIVPAPQHTGKALYTKQIAEYISRETNAVVYDIVRCIPHEMLYEQKLKGKSPTLNMFLSAAAPSGNMFFLDNVIASGTTFRTAATLLGRRLQPLVFSCSYLK